MFSQFFFWLLLLLYLTPLLITGIILLRKTTLIDRYEVLIPAGCVLGIAIFTFFINLFSFFTKSNHAIYLAYVLLLFIGIFMFKLKVKAVKISFPSKRSLLFCLTSILAWLLLIFWKGNNALIGSDTNLYYSIAHTYLKGNFPPMTPWQPDLPLSYHLGSLQLLAAFYLFTNISFEFLHIFFSCFFIFLSSQLIVWIRKRHTTVISFIFGNLFAGIILVSSGFLKVIFPYFPLKFPEISNFHQLFLWIRNLPTVNQSIEVYGAPINLDVLIYFIFHAFGLALVLSLISVIYYTIKKRQLLSWVILLLGLPALSIINESIFVISAPALIFANLLNEIRYKSSFQNVKYIILALVFSAALVIFQGGVITNSIFPPKGMEKTILVFPDKSEIRQDFISYHHYQQVSKVIPQRQEWLPFSWFHIGTDILIFIAVISFIFVRFSAQQKVLLCTLLVMGISSLFAYNFIVPKYLVANGNRFLSFAFITLSLFILFVFQKLFDNFSRKLWLKYIVLTFLTLFIFIPTILPPGLLLTKTRFGENKLIPKTEQASSAIDWMKDNLTFNSRVVVLDAATPHPSGQARAMVQAGVFAPIFTSDFRAYTIEASPPYLDIAYYLSPRALKQLGINYLLMDSHFFETLPRRRKQQLDDQKYFTPLFTKVYPDLSWEKVFQIYTEYTESGGELLGTISELTENIPGGKIYIDNEENFNPSFLRRAIIFSLRNKDLYFLPQSGVYLNVEANINSNPPLKDGNYDYLVLGKNTDPKNKCKCSTKLIWKGLSDEVYVWGK